MKYFKTLATLVFVVLCLPLGSGLQAQTGAETPELSELPDTYSGLTADMTHTAELYTDLMLATYFKTGNNDIRKSKFRYDTLIDKIEADTAMSTSAENRFLTARGISFIYAERAALRFPKLQDIKGAEEDAAYAVELNPENIKALWVLAQIATHRFTYRIDRDRNGKIMFDMLKRVVELDQDHYMAHIYLGNLARDFGEEDLAINSFKALTRIIPYDEQHHSALAELYEGQGRLEEAVQSYERVVTIRPEQKATRNRIGQLYLQLGAYPKAIETFLELLPGDETAAQQTAPAEGVEIEAHQGISLAYQAQDDFERSEFHSLRAIALIEAEVKKTRSAFRTRSSERVELAKRLRDARYTLGQIYLKFGEPQKAVETFTQVLATDAEYVPALSGIGIAYQMQKDTKRAETYLRRAIKLATAEEVPDAYNALGYLYAEQGINLEEAATLVRRALKTVPKSGAYLDSLGLIYFKQGKLDAAIENLEQARDYLPNTPDILIHLADAYLGKGLKQKALQTLEQAVRLEPNNPELLQRLDAVKSR